MQPDTITLRELTIRYSVKADATGQPVIIGRTLSTGRRPFVSRWLPSLSVRAPNRGQHEGKPTATCASPSIAKKTSWPSAR